jgi:ferredoxin-thioredoxin reductase catalytic subunit
MNDECGAVGGMIHGKQKYSEKTCPCLFVNHRFYMTRPRLEPGPPQWEVED